MENLWDRRVFVKQMFTGSMGLWALPYLSLKKSKVIVLGGGISGLLTAYLLQEKGFEVQVLEAKNKLGGRILTHKTESSAVIELGAEWIGREHTSTLALCRKLGLEMSDHAFKTSLFTKNTLQKPSEWDISQEGIAKIQTFQNDFLSATREQRQALNQISWMEYLESLRFSVDDLYLLSLAEKMEYGTEIYNISALQAMQVMANSQNSAHDDFRITKGNITLPETLANKIGNENIKLNQKVLGIENKNKQVTVRCAKNQVFTGDFLVCSLPIPAILNIKWNGALPKNIFPILENSKYASISKSAYIFDNSIKRNDDQQVLTDCEIDLIYHATQNQDTKNKVLMASSSGRNSKLWDLYNESQKQEIFKRILQNTKSNFIWQNPSQALHSNWNQDEFSKGAFICQDFNFQKVNEIFSCSYNKIFFAGEHTNSIMPNTIEGAIRSSEKVVEMITKL